jgi:hypothetical protein
MGTLITTLNIIIALLLLPTYIYYDYYDYYYYSYYAYYYDYYDYYLFITEARWQPKQHKCCTT